MGNSLTDALKFKKTMGPRGPQIHHVEPGAQGHHGVLAFHHSKVPNLANAKPGDAVTIQAHGSVHHIDPNGNMTMHVHDIKPDSTDMKNKQYPPQGEAPMVRMQTEHA